MSHILKWAEKQFDKGSSEQNAIISALFITTVPLVLTILIPANRIPKLALSACIAFAVGSLLGDVFTHILSEHLHQVENGGLLVLSGILGFMCIDRLVSAIGDGHDHHDHHGHHHHHHHGHSHDDSTTTATTTPTTPVRRSLRNRSNRKASTDEQDNGNETNEPAKSEQKSTQSKNNAVPILTLFGNIMHTLTDGMQLGIVHSTGVPSTAINTTLAILMHEVPHKLSDYAIYVNSGYSLPTCILMQLIMSLGTFAGVVGVMFFKNNFLAFDEAKVMLISAGGLIYTALVGILPGVLAESRASIGRFIFVLGFLVAGIWFMASAHHDHSHGHDNHHHHHHGFGDNPHLHHGESGGHHHHNHVHRDSFNDEF